MVNESGIMPCEYKVLLKLDTAEKVTEGGIIIPEPVNERESMAQTTATVVDFGGNAFEDWKEPRPHPGCRAVVAKYAGQRIKGKDGEEYRLTNDKDVAAILEPNNEVA